MEAKNVVESFSSKYC